MPTYQASNWFHEPISFTKNNLEFSFWFVNPFSNHFFVNVCFLFVGVAGLEPAKESELQRLPPYQLGYTPRFRPLLNYQLLVFLGLASIHTLSQWDSNPSLRVSHPVCNTVHHLPKAKLPPFQYPNWFQEPIFDKTKYSKLSLLCQGQF